MSLKPHQEEGIRKLSNSQLDVQLAAVERILDMGGWDDARHLISIRDFIVAEMDLRHYNMLNAEHKNFLADREKGKADGRINQTFIAALRRMSRPNRRALRAHLPVLAMMPGEWGGWFEAQQEKLDALIKEEDNRVVDPLTAEQWKEIRKGVGGYWKMIDKVDEYFGI